MLDWLIFGLLLVMVLVNTLNIYLWLTRPKPQPPRPEPEMVKEYLGELVRADIMSPVQAAEDFRRYMDRKEAKRPAG